jgi:hypothetical protein
MTLADSLLAMPGDDVIGKNSTLAQRFFNKAGIGTEKLLTF